MFFNILFRKRASFLIVFAAEIGPCFPKFGKEFLVERRAEIADAVGASGASFRSYHALDHLDVMRAPERKVFVVFKQRFGKLVFFIQLFGMRENLNHRSLSLALISAAFFIVTRSIDLGSIETPLPQQRKKSLSQRRRVQACVQTLSRKIILSELMQDRFVFQTGSEFNLAKLQRLKTAGRI